MAQLTEEMLARTRRRNSRRHVLLHKRAGAGFPQASKIVLPGTAIATPVSAAEGLRAVTLVFEIEFFDGVDYPAGDLVLTGELTVAMTAPGVLTAVVPTVPTLSLSADLSDVTIPGGGHPPSGRHVIAVFIDPANNRGGLLVDGNQVDQATGAFTLWADGIAAWEYMNTVTDVGFIGDLEIFHDFVPPTFVG